MRMYSLLSMVIGLLFVLPSNFSYADPPQDYYQVRYEDISPQVLKDTIGIITVYQGELPTYTQTNTGFIHDRTIHLGKDTIPISMQGYFGGTVMLTKQEYQSLVQAVPAFKHAHENRFIEEGATVSGYVSMAWVEENATSLGITYYYLLKKAIRVAVDPTHDAGYRYPIIAQHHEYLRIVSDPIHNHSIWINRAEISQYHKSIIMFDYINENQGRFFDLFYLVNKQDRILYAEPDIGSKQSILRFQDHPFQTFQITEQKNGFAKVVKARYDGQAQELGWTRIRDKEGQITLWTVYIDMY